MAKRTYVSNIEASYFNNNKMMCGNNIPISGDYIIGDIMISNTQNDDIFGWVCVESGNPGKWEVIVDLELIKQALESLTNKSNELEELVNTLNSKIKVLESVTGDIDLSGFVTKDELSNDITEIENKVNINTTNITSITNDIKLNYQTIVDQNLVTENKTVIGAINELKQWIDEIRDLIESGGIVQRVPCTGIEIPLENIDGAIIIDGDNIEINIGDTVVLDATVTPSNTTDEITWSVDDNSVATVDKNGTIVGVGEGSCTITGSCGDYSDTCNITVNEVEEEPEEIPCTGITFTSIGVVDCGNTVSVTFATTPSNTTDEITFSIADTSIASGEYDTMYSREIKLTGKKAGTTTLTVYCGDASASTTITVNEVEEEPEEIPCTGITFTSIGVVDCGNTVSVTFATTPSNTTDEITFSIADTSIASGEYDTMYSREIKLTGKKAGTTTLTVYCGDASASTTITVNEVITEIPCTGIDITEDTVNMNNEVGTTYQLNYTITPSNTTDEIVWSTDNSNVQVSNGLITINNQFDITESTEELEISEGNITTDGTFNDDNNTAARTDIIDVSNLSSITLTASSSISDITYIYSIATYDSNKQFIEFLDEYYDTGETIITFDKPDGVYYIAVTLFDPYAGSFSSLSINSIEGNIFNVTAKCGDYSDTCTITVNEVEVEEESYSITYNASNVTYNYQPTSITSNEHANIVVTCDDGYVFNNIVVTMNGTDITNDCLSDLDYVGDTQNLIALSDVTGDIVININVKEEEFVYDISTIPLVCAGDASRSFVLDDGCVYGTGADYYGALGANSSEDLTSYTKFIEIPYVSDLDIKKMVTSARHSVLLTTDGLIYACGVRDLGRIGDGYEGEDNNFCSYFKQIESATADGVAVKDVACTIGGIVIVKENGKVWSTGEQHYGELGITNEYNLSFGIVDYIDDVTAVSSGPYHTIFVKNDGTLWGMGQSNYGQLGYDTNLTTETYEPVQITTNVNNIKKIECGYSSTFMLKQDGTLWGTGWSGTISNDNSPSVFGLGVNADANYLGFVQIADNVKDFAVGLSSLHTLILKNDGTLWGTGDNERGQLGLNDIVGRNIWTQITENIDEVSYMACGDYHSMIIQSDGSVWGTGDNSMGQIGLGDDVTNVLVFTKSMFNEEITEIPCTGIDITEDEINLPPTGSQGDTYTITATVTPSNTTDEIVWSIEDNDYFSITDGVITRLVDDITTYDETLSVYQGAYANIGDSSLTESYYNVTTSRFNLKELIVDKGVDVNITIRDTSEGSMIFYYLSGLCWFSSSSSTLSDMTKLGASMEYQNYANDYMTWNAPDAYSIEAYMTFYADNTTLIEQLEQYPYLAICLNNPSDICPDFVHVEVYENVGEDAVIVHLDVTAKCGDYSDTCTITVNEEEEEPEEIPCTGITLSATTLTLDEGDTYTITATVTPSNTTDEITWSNNVEQVASMTVSEDGKSVTMLAKNPATTTVTATCGDYSDRCTITVNEVEEEPETIPAIPCTGIDITEDIITVYQTSTETYYTIDYTVTPSNTTDGITWSIQNKYQSQSGLGVGITIDDNGVLTIPSTSSSQADDMIVTVTCGDYSDTCTIKAYTSI